MVERSPGHKKRMSQRSWSIRIRQRPQKFSRTGVPGTRRVTTAVLDRKNENANDLQAEAVLGKKRGKTRQGCGVTMLEEFSAEPE